MIKKDNVRYMAKLARLALGSEEERFLQEDLSDILKYVDKLKTLKINNQKVSYLSENKNISRADIEKDFKDNDLLIKSFNEKEGRFLKVKSIL